MQSFGYIREMKVDMTRTIEQDLEKLGWDYEELTPSIYTTTGTSSI